MRTSLGPLAHVAAQSQVPAGSQHAGSPDKHVLAPAQMAIQTQATSDIAERQKWYQWEMLGIKGIVTEYRTLGGAGGVKRYPGDIWGEGRRKRTRIE